MAQRSVVLCILDGWGEGKPSSMNAIHTAHTPTWDHFKKHYPSATLKASGLAVGLPEGQMGNSEVGHMTLGAGRVFLQSLPRISEAVTQNALPLLPQWAQFIQSCQSTTKTCHVMGLVSPGGVHSHQSHLEAVCLILAEAGIKVWVHAFLDGRDTPPQSALEYVEAFLQGTAKYQEDIQIASLSGRYYSMDRDKRWERLEKAYLAIGEGKAQAKFTNPLEAIKSSYAQGISDEFLVPQVSSTYLGVQPGDSLFMGNFRADRGIQLLSALLLPDFSGFLRPRPLEIGPRLAFVEYADFLTPLIPALFSPPSSELNLGEVLAIKGLKQLRLAETEKYAHVTYFFNGGRETVFEGEQRVLIPSPKVTSYDQTPALAAVEITDQLVQAIASQQYALIVVNYANADMVGHTGNFQATQEAIECLDSCFAKIEKALLEYQTTMLITADHGNAEQMIDEITHGIQTSHTINEVPVILINAQEDFSLRHGELQDIAPTILDLLELAQPTLMTGTFFAHKRERERINYEESPKKNETSFETEEY